MRDPQGWPIWNSIDCVNWVGKPLPWQDSRTVESTEEMSTSMRADSLFSALDYEYCDLLLQAPATLTFLQ